jgi:hypothetical protein
MDAFVEVRNETCLRDAGLLQSSFVLSARSLVACPAIPVPLASPTVAPPASSGESASLHYDHYGRDGQEETFCYRKRKAPKA